MLSVQRQHLLLRHLKTVSYLSGRVLNQQPSTRQACASIELSVWRLDQHVKESGLQDNLQPSECSFDENEQKCII